MLVLSEPLFIQGGSCGRGQEFIDKRLLVHQSIHVVKVATYRHVYHHEPKDTNPSIFGDMTQNI